MEESWFEMLVESCGYIATFVGVMMEGEVSLATSVPVPRRDISAFGQQLYSLGSVPGLLIGSNSW